MMSMLVVGCAGRDLGGHLSLDGAEAVGSNEHREDGHGDIIDLDLHAAVVGGDIENARLFPHGFRPGAEEEDIEDGDGEEAETIELGDLSEGPVHFDALEIRFFPASPAEWEAIRLNTGPTHLSDSALVDLSDVEPPDF